MAYGNVTPPSLPTYDAETNGFYLLVFNYELEAENWYMVHLIYGAWRFQYEEGVGITNTGNTFTRTYSDGVWSEESQNTVALALNPGTTGNVYQRIYTNANIFNGDDIWLAENTVTPLDEEQRQINMKSQLAGFLASWVSRVRQFPHREPVDNAPVLIATELDFGGFIDGNTNFDVGGYPSNYTVTETKGTNVTALHYGVFFDSVDYWRLCVPGKKYRMQAKFPKIEYTLPSGVEKTSESIYISFPGAALTYPNPPYRVDCDVDVNGISVLLDPHPDYPNAYNHLSAEMTVNDGYYVLTIEYEISSLQDNPGGYLYISRWIAVSPDREVTRTVIYPVEPLKIWEI